MTNKECSADLDRRELLWFKLHRDWAPQAGADIPKWLSEMRVEDDRLADLGNPSKPCPNCDDDYYCRACG